jgi:hypothetical protein
VVTAVLLDVGVDLRTLRPSPEPAPA